MLDQSSAFSSQCETLASAYLSFARELKKTEKVVQHITSEAQRLAVFPLPSVILEQEQTFKTLTSALEASLYLIQVLSSAISTSNSLTAEQLALYAGTSFGHRPT